MKDWIIPLITFFIGIGVGSYFTSLSRMHKPWSELTEREKRWIVGLTVTGVILLISGILVFILRN